MLAASLIACLFAAPPEASIDLQAVVETARTSTVRVLGESFRRNRRTRKWGAGVLVGENNVVLTCMHTVEGHAYFYITTHDQREHRAQIVAVFPDLDLAILNFASTDPYVGVDVHPQPVTPNLPAIVVGYPWGGQRSVILGRIKTMRSDIRYAGVREDLPLLSFQAETMLGFSGGPLFSIHGKLVGMVVARTDGVDSVAVTTQQILAALNVPSIPFRPDDAPVLAGHPPTRSPAPPRDRTQENDIPAQPTAVNDTSTRSP
jgi:S1-C subfamily serine protease